MVVYIEGSVARTGAFVSPDSDYGDHPDAVDLESINKAIVQKVRSRCGPTADVFDVFAGLDERISDQVQELNDMDCNDLQWDLDGRINQTTHNLLDDYRDQKKKGLEYDPDMRDWEATRRVYERLLKRLYLIKRGKIIPKDDQRDQDFH